MTKLASKLLVDGYGSYLGVNNGCFTLKDDKGDVIRYPMFEQEIGEVILQTGGAVSIGALATFGFWDIDVLVLTARGRPVAILKSLNDDSYVQTRIAQYQASLDDRAYNIINKLLIAKLQSQNILLSKYNYKIHSDDFIDNIELSKHVSLDLYRRRMNGIEGKHTQRYYEQIYNHIPDKIRPKRRENFMAYDGVNNVFNLAYEILAWKIHIALVKAKLEPYLGFLHSNQIGKMSLKCDFQELYRYMIDDYLLEYFEKLRKSDFSARMEVVSKTKRGKRVYLKEPTQREFMRELNNFFERTVAVKRIRNGEHQTLETLINEEALLFAKYLRGEIKSWIPRIADI